MKPTRLLASDTVLSKHSRLEDSGVAPSLLVGGQAQLTAQLRAKPGSTRVAPFELLGRDASCSYALSGRVFLIFGRTPPTERTALHLRRVLRGQFARFPDGFAHVSVIQPASTPTPKAREIIARAYLELWSRLWATLFVIEGRGFQAAIQHSIIGAVAFASGQRSRIRIVSHLDDQLRWLTRAVEARGHAVPSLPALARAIRTFCNAELAPDLPNVQFVGTPDVTHG